MSMVTIFPTRPPEAGHAPVSGGPQITKHQNDTNGFNQTLDT